jgi:hypothetical protein
MLSAIIAKRDAILYTLRVSFDTLQLQQADMELALLHVSRDWRTCKSYLDRFFDISNGTASSSSSNNNSAIFPLTSVDLEESFTNQIVCTEEYTNYFGAAFFADTCCYPVSGVCCPGTNLNQSLDSYIYNSSSAEYVSMVILEFYS